MEEKKKFGQFYTTNQKYILNGFTIPNKIINIIEPFAGNGDLKNFIDKDDKQYQVEYYDIQPKQDYIIKKDTLNNPPDYTNKFLITNPPYLARNKSNDKSIFNKYDVNDLYKCLVKELLTNICLGGILIIPLNFWSSIRKNDIKLRELFLEKYNIVLLNIFEEKVFEDTTSTICSFQFEIKNDNKENKINIMIYPSKNKIETILNNDNNYLIGGDIYKLKLNNKYKITRLTKKNIDDKNTNILAKCIDDNKDNKISLSLVNDDKIYIDQTPNLSSRTYATLVITPPIDKNKQTKLVENFNEYLNNYREKYNSLFLTNYRESKDIARKRISFSLVYSIVQYILDLP
tara:strand:+ start:53 stop:1087 length:1035 start_codon:yes stop_codon:yes gene_type:complete